MSWRTGQSYSQDLRDRVLAAVDGGMAVRQAAVTFSVSIAYIYKALIRRRSTGDARPASGRGRPPRKLSLAQEAALAEYVRAHPGTTLAKMQAWLLDDYSLKLSIGALWLAVRRLGLSFKKSPEGRRARSTGRRKKPTGMAGGAALHRP